MLIRLLLACLVGISLTAAAEPPFAPGDVVVRFSEEARDALPADGRVPSYLAPFDVQAIRPVLRRHGRLDGLRRRFGLDRLYVLELPDSADVPRIARILVGRDEIVDAHPNYLGRGGTQVVADDTVYPDQWNLDNTGQTGGTPDADMDVSEAWSIAVGRRETLIAIPDSGIDGDHPQFRGRIARGGIDFVNGDDDPEGDNAHGTAVAGIILATANDAFSVAGINWRAPALPIKVLNASNSGTTVDLILGIDFSAEAGADISNLSLIHYPNVSSLADAVAFADAAGVVQIGCNGNDGNSLLNYPASYREVLATGWSNHNDVRDPGSNTFDPDPVLMGVMAPGSTVRTVRFDNDSDTSSTFSGCSAATPNAVGVASVLLGLDPTLSSGQIQEILKSTADDEVGPPADDPPGRDANYGWGRVNMEAALASLGLESIDAVHVDSIVLGRATATRLDIEVAVVDDLTGAEDNVQVDGTLTLPDLSTMPLTGPTDTNGVATLSYDAGVLLPPGAYTFRVDGLAKPGFTHDASADHETERTHEPGFDGVHVQAIDLHDDFGDLTIEVQIVDDDGLPEGGVEVKGRLDRPGGGSQNFTGDTIWAGGGAVRFVYSPGGLLDPGLYSFEVTQVNKSGFTHESSRDVETSDSHTVLSATGDEDADTVDNVSDNCVQVSNVAQTDSDLDGFGDDCDVCPFRVDPAQTDADGDGVGDRCDCAAYDPAETGVAEVRNLRFESTTELRWSGVSGADFYDVSRGDLLSLDGTDFGQCRADNISRTSLQDTQEPPPGEGYFYVVRGDDLTCGPGSYGAGRTPAGCSP